MAESTPLSVVPVIQLIGQDQVSGYCDPETGACVTPTPKAEEDTDESR